MASTSDISSSSHSHSSSSFVPYPPPFLGDGSSDFAHWCKRFEIAAHSSGWHEAIWAQILPNHLGNTPFDFWYSLSDNEKDDFQTAKKRLSEAFCSHYSCSPPRPRHSHSSHSHNNLSYDHHSHRSRPRSPVRELDSHEYLSPPVSPSPSDRRSSRFHFQSPPSSSPDCSQPRPLSPPRFGRDSHSSSRLSRKLPSSPPPSATGHYNGDRQAISSPPRKILKSCLKKNSHSYPPSPSHPSASSFTTPHTVDRGQNPSPPPPSPSPSAPQDAPPTSASALCEALMDSGIRLYQAQHQNPIIRQVTTWVRTGSVPPKSSIPRYEECLFKYRTQFDRLVIRDGLLCRRKRHPSGTIIHQLIIPHSLIPTVLSIVHSSPSAQHFGKSKTIQLFEELCYWHGMRKDIADLCSHCQECNSYCTSLFPSSSLPHRCDVISHPSALPTPPIPDLLPDTPR